VYDSIDIVRAKAGPLDLGDPQDLVLTTPALHSSIVNPTCVGAIFAMPHPSPNSSGSHSPHPKVGISPCQKFIAILRLPGTKRR
jgi:hypothetical protein